MTLRGILFDMGETLLQFRPAHLTWEELETHCGQTLYAHLHTRNYTLPPQAEAIAQYWAYFRHFWSDPARRPVTELKIEVQMREVARLWGITELPADDHAALCRLYLQSMQRHVRPFDDAIATLRALRARGLRVGLISNTIWRDADHLTDLERFELAPYLEHCIFSGDAEVWKPQRAIFERGLAALDLEPHEAAYVGDSLYFDVWGSQQAGLRGVWIESPTHLPDGLQVTPDATIQTLSDLLPVVEQWQTER